MNIMSQFLFKAKLLNVDSSTNEKGVTWRLIFESQRYDKGLDQWVPCSQNVKIIDDHVHLLDHYRSYRNREIFLPVELTPVERNVYLKTTGDGKPLNLVERTNEKTTA